MAQENSAEEELLARQAGIVACDYLLDVCPSLGVNQKTGEAMIALGNNAYVWIGWQWPETDRFSRGDVVLMHHEKIKLSKEAKSSIRNGNDYNGTLTSHGIYEPSAFLYTPKDGGAGHRDVVRCMYHDPSVS